ncbi:MAG: 2TM domain-containing protein [Chloroflexota bacterium]|nr:2TM domain-containing protein [Chloroflexota bacterium]
MTDQPHERKQNDDGFENHLRGYLGFVGFFLILNLVTSPGRWWFYWPVMMWGIFVVFHAFGTYGPYAPVAIVTIIRNWFVSYRGQVPPVLSGQPRPASASTRPEPQSVASPAGTYTAADAETRIGRLWRVARTIENPVTQDKAFQVCAAADRVAEALTQDNAEPQLVTWFIERYIQPTETLLGQYARLERRDVAAAEPALAKVENEDLPLLQSKLDTLYQQLHRGDVVSLQVASEMLEFGLSDPPPRLTRTGSS